MFEKGFTFLLGSGFFAPLSRISLTPLSLKENEDYMYSLLVLDRQDKLETDFYFKAMAVGSMQLMYMWQNKNFKKGAVIDIRLLK